MKRGGKKTQPASDLTHTIKKRVFKDYQITFIMALLICLTKCQKNE